MRIEERHEFLGYYMRMASRGEYGIAAFQRPFVWSKQDVVDYLQSIMDGFPIGSFFIWRLSDDQRDGALSKGRIGPFEHDPSVPCVILDGQNRLSTVVWATGVDAAPVDVQVPYSEAERSVWLSGETLTVSFASQGFAFVPSADAWSPERVPVGDLLAATLLGTARPFELITRMEQIGIPDDQLNWYLDDVPNSFRSKRTVVTELSDATPEQALDVFLRVCKAGQPMSDADLEAARSWIIADSQPQLGN